MLGSGIRDMFGHELEFPSAFRQSRRDCKPRGIVKIKYGGTNMIRNEPEYQEASARLAEKRTRLAEHRARLKDAGLTDDEIKRVIDGMEYFHLQFQEEVERQEARCSAAAGLRRQSCTPFRHTLLVHSAFR